MKLRKDPHQVAKARDLYLAGYTFNEIAEQDNMPSARTLRRWAEESGWAEILPCHSAELTLTRRLSVLTDREKKTAEEYKEFDFITTQINKLRSANNKIQERRQRNAESSENDGRAARRRREKSKQKKNDVSSITLEMLDELREKILYPHQQDWFENREHRTRFILKPRQIGATFYFSFEAFYKALATGKNQIFISASRDQAEIFKANIVALVYEHFGIELSGSPLKLNYNGKTVTLYFKSTNARTAQSASGDLYVDEVFWIYKFQKLRDVAQAMATQEIYDVTYFSTPSVTSHDAYDLWNGKWFRRSMACNDPVFEVDVSYKNLKDGKLCDDYIYRQLLTVEDVVKAGFDKINIELLKREYGEEQYNNLFMGKFLDDAHSAFSLKRILACTCDSDKWADFDPAMPRPYLFHPVAIGFDPARDGDTAALVVMSVPLNDKDKFKVLEMHSLNAETDDFQDMADMIKGICARYRVVHIGIDTTGIGGGVYNMITKFFPMAKAIVYNPVSKNEMINKALHTFKRGRIAFDDGAAIIANSFLNIRKKVSGDKVLYITNRTATTGHGDFAWAIMHALIFEPLDADLSARETQIGFSDAA